MIQKKQSVLLVEDDLIITLLYERILQDVGFETVHTATTAAEAHEKAASQRPSLIIMDIILKGPDDGIECAQAIRKTLDIPIIFVSGVLSNVQTMKRLRDISHSGFLSKPIDRKTLRNTISEFTPDYPVQNEAINTP